MVKVFCWGLGGVDLLHPYTKLPSGFGVFSFSVVAFLLTHLRPIP